MCAARAARLLSDLADRSYVLCACATQQRLLFEAVLSSCSRPRSMQRERPQSVKVRPRTAIGRAPLLTAQPTRNMHEVPWSNRAFVPVRVTAGRPRVLCVHGQLIRCHRGRGTVRRGVWWPWLWGRVRALWCVRMTHLVHSRHVEAVGRVRSWPRTQRQRTLRGSPVRT